MDATGIQGTWECVSAVSNGREVPADAVRQLRLVLTATGYRTTMGDQTLFEGTYTLTRDTDPGQIDIAPRPGEAGTPASGIYDLEGDTLKLCYPTAGGARPTAFASGDGSGLQCVVWKRAAK
jgi:uncharacterized protein (TIGR03067 family)